jgi:hypothetical protein
MLCLVNLLRSLYGQPALINDTGGDKSLDPNAGRPIAESSGHSAGQSGSDKVWPVPALSYHHVGARVVLLMRLDGDQLSLKALEVPGDKFEQLLFCRVAVHRRACYSDRMQRLEAGELESQA